MNKNLIVAGVVALLIVLGVGAFVMSKNSSNPSSQNSTNSQATGQSSSPKSIKDLLTGSDARKCTYTDKMEGVDMTGTAYVAGGRVRTDTSGMVGGKSYMAHMIIKDNTSYTWVDGQATGMMMEYNPDEVSAPPTGTPGTSEAVDVNKYVDYSCSDWSADESVFTPPANIKFQSMGSMTAPTSGAGSQTSPQSNCAMCNYLSGDSKTKCLAELKCN